MHCLKAESGKGLFSTIFTTLHIFKYIGYMHMGVQTRNNSAIVLLFSLDSYLVMVHRCLHICICIEINKEKEKDPSTSTTDAKDD